MEAGDSEHFVARIRQRPGLRPEVLGKDKITHAVVPKRNHTAGRDAKGVSAQLQNLLTAPGTLLFIFLLPIIDRQSKGSVERFGKLLDVVRPAGKSDPLKGDVHAVERGS